MLKRFFRKINPFVREIKYVSLGSTFERHGNCIDIKFGSNIYIETKKPQVIYVPLGFKAQLPKHYRGVLTFRSSTPARYNIDMPASHGEIEWDYSDEWKGIIKAFPSSSPVIPKDSRLFQFYIEPVWDAPWYVKLLDIFSVFRFEKVEELSTSRSGLGHTGI